MWIEQSTAITIKVGPFLDEDDGKTVEAALAITQADIRLCKNGGNFAQVNDNQGGGNITYDEFGWYDVDLDATDTNTLGRLIVAIHESGALPVWREFMVVPSNVWDSVVGGTDYLEVDAVAISGDTGAADNAELAYDGTGYGFTGCTMPTTTTVTNQVSADVTAISGDAGAANNCESAYDGTGYGFTGCTMPTTTAVTNQVTADVTAISGDAGAANNAESAFDGTGYGFANCTMPTTTTVTNQVTADMTAISGDAGAANNLESYCDGTDRMPVDVQEIGNAGNTTAAENLEDFFDGTGYDATANSMNITQIEGVDATDQINAACDASIETYDLDHLMSAACDGAAITGNVVDNSVIAFLAAIGGDISDYDDSTDSLEALGMGLYWDEVMDANAPANCNTAKEYMNVMVSALAGKTTSTGDWGSRDLGDTKDRIVATLTAAGKRSSIDTLDGT